MSDDRKIAAVEQFGDADELRQAIDTLIDKSIDLGDMYPSIEGFALQGVAALIEIDEGSASYTIELFDEVEGAHVAAQVPA